MSGVVVTALRNVAAYFRSRFRDPVVWLALSVMGAWGISAAFGLAPYQMLNVVFFGFSAAEWWAILSWWRTRHQISGEPVQTLTPALERWKVAILIAIAAITFALDLWLGSTTLTDLGLGFSVLGISTLVTLWFAWSRPIVVRSAGLLVGIESVPWSAVRRVVWKEAGLLTIDFAHANYFYGTKLTVAATQAQAAEMDRMIPRMIERAAN